MAFDANQIMFKFWGENWQAFIKILNCGVTHEEI